jgi:DNA-binding SARP family transcriptional activator
MNPVTLRALGPPELTRISASVPVELTWRKHLALLVYLARSDGAALRRDHLTGLLWPEKDEPRARHSLNEACRAIRRGVGKDAIESTADTVTLARGAVRSDWEEAEEALAAGDAGRTASLWRGDFMEGFGVPEATGFEDWLHSERALWRRRFRDALSREADLLARKGRHGAALDLADLVLRRDSSAEEALRVAIMAEALTGYAPAALKRYEQYRMRLAEEQGAEPASDIALLAERIRSGRRTRVEPASPPSRLPPLVGRERALARIAQHLPRQGAGASVVFVSGGPGHGKSRLVREVAERARLEGVRVMSLACVSADGDSPGAMLAALARRGMVSAAGLAAAPPDALAALAWLEPEIAQRYPGAAPRRPEGAAILGRAFGEALAAVADEGPVLLSIDDAHLADELSVDALPALVRSATTAPLLLIVAIRPEEASRGGLSELRARVGHDLPGAEVLVEPLDDASVGDLVRELLPGYGREERARLLRRLGRDAGGVPLFIVEIARGLAGRPGVDLWPTAGETTREPLPFPIPGPVTAALTLRVNALSEAARETLLAAAVAGPRVDAGLLAGMLDLTTHEVESRLAELERAGFLRDDGADYHFTAELVRQFLEAEMLTGPERRRAHRRAAELMEKRGTPGRDLAYAEHLAAAGDWPAAAAAAETVRSFALDKGAARLLDRAERLLQRARKKAETATT